MKGPKFFNKKNSPAKVSDSAIIAAQSKLDHVELDFREPGWTKMARGIHEGAKSVMGRFGQKQEAEEGQTAEEKEKQVADDKQQQTNVQDIAKNTLLDEDDNDDLTDTPTE